MANRSLNTRNKVKSLPKTDEDTGVVACLIRLTDACSMLEAVQDRFPEFCEDPEFKQVVDGIISKVYESCEIIERSTIGNQEPEDLSSAFNESISQRLTPDSSRYLRRDGTVDGEKLFHLAKKVGPWECGAAVCSKCPYGVGGDAETQRRECLDYYRSREAKLLVKDELAAGVPYTRSQLESFSRRDLMVLIDVLGVNRFKVKDKSTKALIGTVLYAQKELLAANE